MRIGGTRRKDGEKGKDESGAQALDIAIHLVMGIRLAIAMMPAPARQSAACRDTGQAQQGNGTAVR